MSLPLFWQNKRQVNSSYLLQLVFPVNSQRASLPDFSRTGGFLFVAWILGAFLLVSALVVFFQWQAAQKSDHPEEPVEDDGGLRTRRLRKDNISKEVEVAWEASDLIEIQPGAWAPKRSSVTHLRTHLRTQRKDQALRPRKTSLRNTVCQALTEKTALFSWPETQTGYTPIGR